MQRARSLVRRRGWAGILAAGLVVAAAVGANLGGGRVAQGLVVTSFGEVDPSLVELARDDLSSFFGVPVRVAAAQPLPGAALDPGRGQYNATRLLKALEEVPLVAGERLLALADVDGMTRDMTFVLGLGQLRGRRAVVFLPRLRAGGDEATFRRRVLLDCHHELGHVYGLAHCRDESCVMGFSATVLGCDQRSLRFCSRCQTVLRRLRQQRP